MTAIGCIGLGNMGSALAAKLANSWRFAEQEPGADFTRIHPHVESGGG